MPTLARRASLPLTGAVWLACGALAACSDFTSSNDQARGLPDVAVQAPSFVRDVQPILTRRCSIGGCHSLASAQAGLVLAEGSAYDALVGRESTLRSGAVRVIPFRADSSWLIAMVSPDDDRRNGFSRMPLASTPLTPNQIATLVNWIDEGAPRD